MARGQGARRKEKTHVMAQQKRMVSIPAGGGEVGLNRYLSEIKKFPLLAPEEIYARQTLARA